MPQGTRRAEHGAEVESTAGTAVHTIELSIVIVNFNVKEFLEQALVSVQRALRGLHAEVFVVDNASSDGSAEMVREKFPWVRLIRNKQNVGFATACNQAIRVASGEVILLLNPDTIVQEDTFRKTLDYLRQHPDVGMVGCKILNPDGSLQLACRRSFPTPWVAFTKLSGLSALLPRSRLFGRYNLTYLDPESANDVEAISGSFMAIRSEVLQQIGLLDEGFFMYGEDLDLCYRAHQAGWKIRYIPDTQIIHFKGESAKRRRYDALRSFYQAMAVFVRKHFRSRYDRLSYYLIMFAIWTHAAATLGRRICRVLLVPATDVAFMTFAILAAQLIRFGSLVHWRSFMIVHAIYGLVWLATLTLFECYDRRKFSPYQAMMAVLVGFLVNSSLTFFFKQFAFSRAVVLVAGVLNLITLPGWRFVLKVLPRLGLAPFTGTLGKTLLGRRTVIVGDFASGEALLEKLKSRVDGSYQVVGLVSLRRGDVGREYHGMKVLGQVDQLSEVLERERIQEVIFSTHRISYDRILRIISRAGSRGVNFKLVPSSLEVIIGKATIDRIDDIPLLEVDYRLHRRGYRLAKRTFDLVFAALAGVTLLPVYLWKRYVRGWQLAPVRVFGPGRKPLNVYELRRPDGSVAGWTRGIPWLWSILKGDFSFVGAEVVEVPEEINGELPKGVELQPGLTGLVQVNRHTPLTKEDKERYYLYYLKNYSPLLDLEIIFKALFKI
jgi:GT2 family glycosyltransferase